MWVKLVRVKSRNGAQLLELGKAASEAIDSPRISRRNGAQLLELGKGHVLVWDSAETLVVAMEPSF